jgi:hypothetical protein
MPQALTPLDSLLLTIVLATLAISLPILMLLAIRFLWDRNWHLGRSKESEKLIWQLHRIASVMEHQMNLSFPAVQPGTEEPHDLAYLRPPAASEAPAAQAKPADQGVAQTVTTPTAQPSTAKAPNEPPRTTAEHGGVNSMFGF